MFIPKLNNNKASFVTDHEYNQTYVFILNEETSKYEKKFIYYPDKFETMTQKQILQKKIIFHNIYNLGLKYVWWAMKNKSKIQNPSDFNVPLCRVKDLGFQCVSTGVFTYIIKFLLNKVESPFMDIYFENMPIRFQTLKPLTAYAIGIYFLRSVYLNLRNESYLYDLALNYKEQIVPNELYSSNCEKELSQYLLKFRTQKVQNE